MGNVRRGENKRESWWVKNLTNKTITIGDLLLVPAIKPGKRVDLLHYYTREKVSHSTVLVSLVKARIVSLNKDKIFTNSFPGNITPAEVDEAITPAEENETGGGGGGGDAEDITYTRVNVNPPIPIGVEVTVEEALHNLFYVAPTGPSITSFSHGISTQEMGVTVDNVTLSWVWNVGDDTLISALITHNGGGGPDDVLATGTPGNEALTLQGITKDNTGTKTYKLDIVGALGSDNDTTSSITFLNRRYYGVDTDPAIDSSAEVRALSGQAFASSRASTITYSPVNEYLYYCYPTRFGELESIIFNSFPMTWAFSIVSVTNSSAFTEDFYVYRSPELYVAGPIEIIFS